MGLDGSKILVSKEKIMVAVGDKIEHSQFGWGVVSYVGSFFQGRFESEEFEKIFTLKNLLSVNGWPWTKGKPEIFRVKKKCSKQLQREEYDHLQGKGYPQFEVTEKYENTLFIKDRDTSAYQLLMVYAKAKLEEQLTLEEREPTLVFGKVGFDIWSDQESLTELIQSLTTLGLENAARYVKIGGASHGVKFNLCLPNHPTLAGLDHRLQTNFPHPKYTASRLPDLRTIQIGKRSLCEQFIRDGILPEEIQ